MTDPSPGASTPPRIDRPAIPPEYGLAKATEFVDWRHVEERLANDRVVWIATAGEDGRPSVRPVDAVYVDAAIFVGGSPETRWIADLTVNPHCAIHLDGVDDVVIVEGKAEMLSAVETGLAERLAAASNAKFPEYQMKPDFYRKHGAIAIRPRTVVTWSDISKDPTRFRFDP